MILFTKLNKMPYRKWKPRRRRRRRKRYNKRYNNGIVTLSQNTPLGNSFKGQLRYMATNFNLDPGIGGTAASRVFRLNDLYDPDQTGSGHQPAGFDEMMTFYDHFTVIGAKITATFYNRDTSVAQTVGVLVKDNTTTEGDHRVICESGKTKFLTLGPLGSSKDIGSITWAINPNKFLGRSKPLADPELKGTITSSPQEGCYAHVWAAPTQQQDTSALNCEVLIEYTAVFTEPKLVALS